MKTVTVNQMREIEARAAREFGISEAVLMENAGRCVSDAAETLFTSRNLSKNQRICIFCGSGNNGGDGFVAARHLHTKGYKPEILLIKNPETLHGISLANFESAIKAGISALIFHPDTNLDGCGLIIDAVLGTGLKSAVKEPYLSAIELINKSKLPVIAVDIPSGICADNGDILTAAVKAVVTVSMGAVKFGLTAEKAKTYTGDIVIADIGIPKFILP